MSAAKMRQEAEAVLAGARRLGVFGLGAPCEEALTVLSFGGGQDSWTILHKLCTDPAYYREHVRGDTRVIELQPLFNTKAAARRARLALLKEHGRDVIQTYLFEVPHA